MTSEFLNLKRGTINMYNISPKSGNLISSSWIMLIIVAILSINAVNAKAAITAPFQGALTNNAPIEADADDLNYDRKTGIVIAKGNVVISKGNVTLKADYVRVNIKTEDGCSAVQDTVECT